MSDLSAVKSVFNTVELLGAILIALPTKDLLLSRHVCKAWQQTVDSSIRLQQCLFYRPVDVLRPRNEGREGFTAPYPEAFTRKDGSEFTWRPFSNPMFHGPHTPDAGSNKDTWQAYLNGTVFTHALGIPRLDDLAIWDRQNASWKKMLMCQPAVRSVRLRYVLCGHEVHQESVQYEWVLRAEGGVTAGMVFKALKKLRRRLRQRLGIAVEIGE